MNKTNLKVLVMAIAMLLLGNGAYLNAQVTVGANDVPNATLDVVAKATDATLAGVMAPRVSRQYLNDKDGDYSPAQTGAIVYVNEVNGTAALKAVNVTAIGYYYFDGALWQSLKGGGGDAQFVLVNDNVLRKIAPAASTVIFVSGTGAGKVEFPTTATGAIAGSRITVICESGGQTGLYYNGAHITNTTTYLKETETPMFGIFLNIIEQGNRVEFVYVPGYGGPIGKWIVLTI